MQLKYYIMSNRYFLLLFKIKFIEALIRNSKCQTSFNWRFKRFCSMYSLFPDKNPTNWNHEEPLNNFSKACVQFFENRPWSIQRLSSKPLFRKASSVLQVVLVAAPCYPSLVSVEWKAEEERVTSPGLETWRK